MKNIKLLAIAFTLPCFSCAMVPLASCNKSENGWITDPNFKPRVRQFDSNEWYHDLQGNDLYFEQAMKDPRIFADDSVRAFIVYTYQREIDHIKSNGGTIANSSFKARAYNISIKEATFDSIKHYLVSGVFEQAYSITYHQDNMTQHHIVDEKYNIRIKYETVDFCAIPVPNGWAITTDNPFKISDRNTWKSWMDYSTYNRERYIDKESGNVESDVVTEDSESYYKDNILCPASPDNYAFDSYYFKHAKPYRSIDVKTNDLPEGITRPIVKNADEIKVGADFDTEIVFDEDTSISDWVVRGISLSNGKNLNPSDWSVTTEGNKTYLHINALRDGGPVVSHDLTIHIDYIPEE